MRKQEKLCRIQSFSHNAQEFFNFMALNCLPQEDVQFIGSCNEKKYWRDR